MPKLALKHAENPSLTREGPVFRVQNQDCGQIDATKSLWREQTVFFGVVSGRKSLIFVVRCSGKQKSQLFRVNIYQRSSFLHDPLLVVPLRVRVQVAPPL